VRKATPRDLGALRDALQRLPDLATGPRVSGVEAFAAAARSHGRAAPARGPARRGARGRAAVASREGGVVRAGFDALRDSLHELSHSGKRWIAELESRERERTGITSLKVGYNKVFGYYLEVTNSPPRQGASRLRAPADAHHGGALRHARAQVARSRGAGRR
jgi:DNA mismatch repair protein MutS